MTEQTQGGHAGDHRTGGSANMETGERGDLEWGTVPNLLHSSAQRFGEAIAIVDANDEGGTSQITFNALEARSHVVAKALMAMGTQPGDRVAIWAPNMWEWEVAALGIMCTGAAVVPLNTRFKGGEAEYILNKSRPRVLFVAPGELEIDYVGMLNAPERNIETVEHTVVMRGESSQGTLDWDSFSALASGVSDADLADRATSVSPSDWSDISFTSGTTGSPKAATCSHAQLLRAFRDWAAVTGLQEGDRTLVVAPYFHSFGFKAGWLTALMMGATVYPQQVFDTEELFRRIERDRITVLPGPPSIYQSILNDPRRAERDLTSLRLAVTGASSIPVELILRMRDELSFERIITGYGLTESSGICSMCRFDDDPETIATTSGRAIPDVEIRAVDGDLNEVETGTPGEIIVRGYNVMAGYWEDPDQTAETIIDGWLRTGDIGTIDARGYVTITDRAKDMFIVGGFNAYPAEIENMILRNDAVAAAAVVGAPDERLGEVGAAFVVLREGHALTAEDLFTWCRAEMANYKVPRIIEFVDEIPLSAAGKPDKIELRERARRLAAD